MAVTPNSCVALLEELPVLAVVKRELRRLASRPGSAAMMALAVLDHSSAEAGGEPLRLTALAEKLQVDLSVASRQVASLIEQGAVERVADLDDGRARRLRVTPTGHLLLEQARQAVAELMAAQLEHWQEPELVTLVELLGRLRSDLSGGLGGRSESRTDAQPSADHPAPAGTSALPSHLSRHQVPSPKTSPSDHSGVSLS